MPDLRELYQEVILDHNKRPRNFRKLEGANRMAEGYNPLCGDHVTVYLHLEGDVIKDISFQGSGCAIAKASASIMTSHLKGMSKGTALLFFEKFHQMVTGNCHTDPDPLEMEDLDVFSGVSKYPVRVKCASLAWHTLRAALVEGEKTVSTE